MLGLTKMAMRGLELSNMRCEMKPKITSAMSLVDKHTTAGISVRPPLGSIHSESLWLCTKMALVGSAECEIAGD